MILSPYLLFLFGVVVAAFLVLTARKRREEPNVRQVLCPETRGSARVELDTRYPILNFLKSHRNLHLRDCSRWPERIGCDEACLAQFKPQLMVDGILAKWYDGRNCAMCVMPLVHADWQRGRAAALDENGGFVPLRDMDWTKFPMILDHYRPLCRRCHETRLELRRAAKATV